MAMMNKFQLEIDFVHFNLIIFTNKHEESNQLNEKKMTGKRNPKKFGLKKRKPKIHTHTHTTTQTIESQNEKNILLLLLLVAFSAKPKKNTFCYRESVHE